MQKNPALGDGQQSYLVHVDVVVVWGVVDGFEETLELTRGSAVDDQDEGDPYRRRNIGGVLVPLYVHISFTWTGGGLLTSHW